MIDYNKKLAEEYARHRQTHPGVIRNLMRNGNIGPGTTVLDVGCGTGNYLVALEKATGCKGYGVEPSEGMLSQARGRSPTLNLGLGSAGSLDFRDGTFDLVMSTDVIHHVYMAGEAPAFFREALRVLKPGGKICTVTDSEWVIRHRKPLAKYFPATVAKELQRYPSIATLISLMREAGFEELREDTEELEYELTDAQAYRDKAFSSLHVIGEDDWKRGLILMEEDLKLGPIKCNSNYTLLWGEKSRKEAR